MKILLAVTGSISVYKTYDLMRLLIKDGNQVRVVLSKGAEKFIRSETFKYLGAEAVYTHGDDFNMEKQESNVLHIDLKNWLDRMVIAPATANTIAKLAAGFCDDLLTSVFLSLKEKTCIIFPAMNTNMYESPITERNLKTLNDLPNIFIHSPASGLLACGDMGEGKLPEIEVINEFVQTYSPKNANAKKVVITAGSTVAPLDPVRYLTNPSSGKTGFEIAKAYLLKGHEVVLIYGKLSTFNKDALKELPNFKLVCVETTEDMYKAVQDHFPKADIYISSAAISDIEFNQNDHKIKKSNQDPTLSFNWAKDVLASVIKEKDKQKIISFAAESDTSSEVFSTKWNRKPVDLMIGNKVHSGFNGNAQGFGTDGNEYFFVKDGKIAETKSLTKKELSEYILDFTESLSNE